MVDLVEQLARDAARLSLLAAQLATARRATELRRARRELAGAAVLVVASATAFVLGNGPRPMRSRPRFTAGVRLSRSRPSGPQSAASPPECCCARAVPSAGIAVRQPAARRGRRSKRSKRPSRRCKSRSTACRRRSLGPRKSGSCRNSSPRRRNGRDRRGNGRCDRRGDRGCRRDHRRPRREGSGRFVLNQAVDLALAPGRIGVRVARAVLDRGRET